jgi:hypothetical protein
MSTSEFSYLPESPEQSFGNNKGIFTPKDIYDLTRADKFTQYGQLELIETITLGTDTASIIFDEIQNTKYNVHLITYNNGVCDQSGNRLKLRFFESGVEETASVYQYALQGAGTDTFTEARSTGDDNIHLGVNTQVRGNWADNGYIYIYNAGDNTQYTFTTQHFATMYSVGSAFRSFFGSGVLPQTSSVDQFKIYASNGNIETGLVASLYGIKEYS